MVDLSGADVCDGAANVRSVSEDARPLRQIYVYFLAFAHSETGRFANSDEAIGRSPRNVNHLAIQENLFCCKSITVSGECGPSLAGTRCAYAIFSVGSFKPCVDVPHPSCTETGAQKRIISL